VLQAASLECAPREREAVERKLQRLGFNRVCRAGALQFPPVDWPHDGRPNFAGWLARRPEPGRRGFAKAGAEGYNASL
jgi:hypothetical protein